MNLHSVQLTLNNYKITNYNFRSKNSQWYGNFKMYVLYLGLSRCIQQMEIHI